MMTSELEALKTNEFLRRRKLRIQQVREQSKDLAKKIRQRAKVAQLQSIEDLDTKNAKEYLEHQEKLVKRLQELYIKGVRELGSGHKNADQVNQQEKVSKDKHDLSKSRGKEAVAEIRRKKQEKLDQQKKSLDRKLQARETANEISREKSSSVNKVLAKSSSTKVTLEPDKNDAATVTDTLTEEPKKLDDKGVVTSDMELPLQWNSSPPNEWEPVIPELALPKDSDSSRSAKPCASDVRKPKPNLFALSEEMPSSLRGGLSRVPEETIIDKPSLSLVSQYIQNRDLRLRQPDTVQCKKSVEDLQNIKQTILQTRASKTEVSAKYSNAEKVKSSKSDAASPKRQSVKMYNHSTRTVHDIPCSNKNLVIRDTVSEEDAYSLAMKEASLEEVRKEQKTQKKVQNMRNKVAMSKEAVDKEYKDTMSFLKNLPKTRQNYLPNKTSYLNDDGQKAQNDKKQRLMQYEFKKIQKECKHAGSPYCNKKRRSFSKSPNKFTDDEQTAKDCQYSWMPVPESDDNLVVHTIPTNVKEGKGNVTFANVDYHEYRSRHKHTPPTKDIAGEKISDDTTESSIPSDTSSIENLDVNENSKLSHAERIIIYKILDTKSDTSKSKWSKAKLLKKIARSLSSSDREQLAKQLRSDDVIEHSHKQGDTLSTSKVDTRVSVNQLTEGVYKKVSDKGDNIRTLHITDSPDNTDSNNVPECSCHVQSKSNLGVEWECHDTHAAEKSSKKCKHASKARQSPVVRDTCKTSCLSFKTAKDKNSNNEIKLVDDAGNETGNFYIGATGFLKDNDYEVTIQLRKKDALTKDRKVNTEVKESSSSKLNEQISETLCLRPTPQTSVEKPDSLSSNNVPISTNSNGEDGTSKEFSTDTQSQEQGINTSQNNDSNIHKNSKSPKTVEEKGVGTECSAKADIFRPLTSASTQTNLGSPINRPTFHHMSSSTSTAYMSPPEIILPQYFKRDKNVHRDNINYIYVTKDEDYRNYTHIHEASLEDDENKYCEDTVGCTCRRCQHTTKLIVKQIKTLRHIHESQSQESVKVPPNTARSSSADVRRAKHKSKSTTKSKVQSSPIKSRSFKQNESVPNKNKTCSKPKKCKKLSTNKKRSYQNLNRGTAGKIKSNINNKIKLNPVVKTYVDKLLTLNRAGIKAVDVMNLECSSVTTPGSSIVQAPRNIHLDDNNIKTAVDLVPRISLEQFKDALIAHLLKRSSINVCDSDEIPRKKSSVIFPRKKSVHKVKSLNISKNLSLNTSKNLFKYGDAQDTKDSFPTSSSSTAKEDLNNKPVQSKKKRSKSTPSPRNSVIKDLTCKSHSSEGVNKSQEKNKNVQINKEIVSDYIKSNTCISKPVKEKNSHKISTSKFPPPNVQYFNESKTSQTQSAQTNQTNDDINLMKIAEGKLQNMEKIADLTEKCTLRLSSLAKVLDEVRRNKSSHMYQSISDSEPDIHKDKVSSPINLVEKCSTPKTINVEKNKQEHIHDENKIAEELHKVEESVVQINPGNLSDRGTPHSFEYVSFLQDIPKPNRSRSPVQKGEVPYLRSPSSSSEVTQLKGRAKPPPALLRKSLKHAHDDIIPHELSTVVEVDSPLSVKNKNQSNNNDGQTAASSLTTARDIPDLNSVNKNPDILQTNKGQEKGSSPKIQMMDLKQFNDIMLKPFMSIEEYAKQCNIDNLDEGSKIDTLPRPIDTINDDLSSLNSESSLPDVIAELLKRNIINEPFKFDTTSNVNSTTVSSESSLSTLALLKMRTEKKQSRVMFENKPETSDTMSFSSNPDLENAFKRLGMGWASSTLKKTKERLALSSSSNTSSSSICNFKFRSGHGDIPALVTDTVSSVMSLSKMKEAEQQTSKSKSMTVKQFLAKELANKITFTNKSRRDDTEEEFISLFETKLPDNINLRDLESIEKSVDSGRSTTNPRARTSTPVQIFRSMTYHSSSGSNASNGLFSNADDLSSVKGTSNSMRNHSTSDKDDLTIPNYSLRTKKPSDCSKSD